MTVSPTASVVGSPIVVVSSRWLVSAIFGKAMLLPSGTGTCGTDCVCVPGTCGRRRECKGVPPPESGGLAAASGGDGGARARRARRARRRA